MYKLLNAKLILIINNGGGFQEEGFFPVLN